MMTKQKIKYAVADCLTALGSLEYVKIPDIKWNIVRTAVLSLESILLKIEDDEKSDRT